MYIHTHTYVYIYIYAYFIGSCSGPVATKQPEMLYSPGSNAEAPVTKQDHSAARRIVGTWETLSAR